MDHQGELLFLVAVMHLLIVSQIPITLVLLRQALERHAEFQVHKEPCQLDLQTPGIHLGEIPLGTMKVPSGALRPCSWTIDERGFSIKCSPRCILVKHEFTGVLLLYACGRIGLLEVEL